MLPASTPTNQLDFLHAVTDMVMRIARVDSHVAAYLSWQNRVCEDRSIKGVHMFEGAKKEYDQAINRNATLGELANQKTSSSGWRPSRALTAIVVLSATAIAVALLIIL
jgi:hypothetical protein